MRLLLLCLLASALALALVSFGASSGAPAPRALAARWQGLALGVCWEGSPRPIQAEEVAPLAALGANAVSQTPFAFMRDPRRPELSWRRDARGWWGERAEGVRFLAQAARQHDIGTLLKPHIWLHGSWPGEVEMASEEDWAAWFAAYREFLLEWARFAAAEGIEGLCIGTELDRTALRADDWRALIREVRGVFPGLLTYAANWDRFEEVPFWDELDAIGVNAYFPLTETAKPSVEELVRAWEPIKARLARLSARHGRPVVFTEIGYHPVAGAFAAPWTWDPGDAPRHPESQAAGYEAVARAFHAEPWFGGVFWWKWHASAAREGRRADRATFSPQGLPAEDVLRRTFTAARSR